ncbi:hypothetical protein M8J76_002551 [Diaphorina citri]|nr:hypothetical protein M8J76_002551 [Diaphorina citri]
MNFEELFDGIRTLDYPRITNHEQLKVSIDGGLKNVEFTKLVAWLCKEIKVLLKLDEDVTSTQDSSSLLLELSSFLKELGCPYKCLIEGHVNSRLRTPETCMLLLDYLINEVNSARMYRVNFPDTKNEMSITINESSTAKYLRDMLMALKFNKPPENISPEQLFGRVLVKVSEILKTAPPALVGKQMFNGELSPKQWETLMQVQNEMAEEYRLRREMLLTRLDCTIESFKWSDRLKGKEAVIEKVYSEKRDKLSPDPTVSLADLLAAREDLAIAEKTSNSNVIIGQVPDRGGRPSEQQAPPPEMPSWQQRNAGGGGGRGGGFSGGRGGGGGGRGGGGGGFNSGGDQRRDSGFTPGGGSRVQAGWTPGNNNYQVTVGYQHDNRGGGYQNNRNGGGYSQGGGYQDNRGYQQDNRGGYQQDRGYQDRYQQGGDRGGYHNSRGGGYHESRGGRGGRGRGSWY